MKVPPSPSEKTPPPPIPLAEPGPRRSAERDFIPRYVALPQRRELGHGRRNLVSGVILLILAAFFLVWALHLAGTAAVVTVGVCLATATLLHVMARSRLFRQRNGSFLAWASVCFLGTLIVLLQQGWRFATDATPLPLKLIAAASPAAAAAPDTAALAGTAPPLLREAFPAPKGDPIAGLTVRITRDITVRVGEKVYRAKAGDTYPLADVGIGEMTVTVGDHEALVPSNAAEMVGSEKSGDKLTAMTPAPLPGTKGRAAEEKSHAATTAAEILDESQKEAVRRYPALGRRGSPENQLYLTARREQQYSGEKEFFTDPHWPLELAEILAAKEGWQRADQPATPAPGSPQATDALAPEALPPAPRMERRGADSQLFPPALVSPTSP